MLTYDMSMALIQSAMDGLYKAELLDAPEVVDGEFQIIGLKSPLDSIILVTFLVELENVIEDEVGTKKRLVLDKIHDFNVNDSAHKFDPKRPTLHADTLARYMMTL